MLKYFPKISIIMNCHNGEKYLSQSIKSILNQTYSNWELIFFNNKSTDKSSSIIKNIKDKRIRYFESKNFLKLYDARNKAINYANGKFIAFLDTDDLWAKNKLKTQVIFLKKNNLKACFSNFHTLIEKKNKKILRVKKAIKKLSTQDLLNDYNIGILTVLIDKKIFKKKFNSKYSIIGDFDYFINLSLRINLGYINSSLAVYRVHSNNLSIKKNKLYINELKNWLKSNKAKFVDLGMNLSKQRYLLFKLKVKGILDIV
jgi:glycosyltransferase involved in cell wall biosynthesis